jgi:cell division protein FtsW (lipid II flippase)
VRLVSESVPTPDEARSALAKADGQAIRVRRADRQLAWMLLGIAAIYLAVGAVISTLQDPRRGGPVVGLAIVTIVIVGAVGFIFVGLRIRAYSRGAILLYFGGVIAFNFWNGFVSGVSIVTRWWASTEPGYHFGLSAAVAVIPLLVAAWLIWRR